MVIFPIMMAFAAISIFGGIGMQRLMRHLAVESAKNKPLHKMVAPIQQIGWSKAYGPYDPADITAEKRRKLYEAYLQDEAYDLGGIEALLPELLSSHGLAQGSLPAPKSPTVAALEPLPKMPATLTLEGDAEQRVGAFVENLEAVRKDARASDDPQWVAQVESVAVRFTESRAALFAASLDGVPDSDALDSFLLNLDLMEDYLKLVEEHLASSAENQLIVAKKQLRAIGTYYEGKTAELNG